jgi:hypothetical protein
LTPLQNAVNTDKFAAAEYLASKGANVTVMDEVRSP